MDHLFSSVLDGVKDKYCDLAGALDQLMLFQKCIFCEIDLVIY